MNIYVKIKIYGDIMKNLVCVLCVVLFLSLCACTPQNETDINEFLKILETGNIVSASAEDFRITKDSERYRYSYVVNDKMMLCLYSDKNGVIIQCTVTSLVKDAEFSSACSEITRTFTGKSSKKSKELVKSAFYAPIISDGYKLVLIDSQTGFTFIINHESDELNTNEYPTLKRHIDEEDISRPTVSQTELSTIND